MASMSREATVAVETERNIRELSERADEKTCGQDEEECHRDLSDKEGVQCRVRLPRVAEGAAKSIDGADSRGAHRRYHAEECGRERRGNTVKPSVRQSSDRSSATGTSSAGICATSRRLAHVANSNPSAAPVAASPRLSRNKCLKSTQRDAPRASRIVSSLRRAAPRPRNRMRDVRGRDEQDERGNGEQQEQRPVIAAAE